MPLEDVKLPVGEWLERDEVSKISCGGLSWAMIDGRVCFWREKAKKTGLERDRRTCDPVPENAMMFGLAVRGVSGDFR